MVTPRRCAAFLLALAIFTGWFALLRPTALGGPATFLIISGDSMEPVYSHGDLVVLHRDSSYQAGDIVAYPMRTHFDTGRLVIHRVVGADSDGFITRGDNRDRDDPWRATDADIRGAAWTHVPKLGTYLAWLRQPLHLGGLVAGIFLMGGIGTAETQRRRRHGMRRYLRGAGNAAGSGPAFGGYQPALAGIAVAAAVVAVAFLVLGVLAFRSATHTASQVSQPTYTETGTFDYAIEMEPSTLYPDGILRPPAESGSDPLENGEEGPSPAPAFTALAREARVTFQYELASEGAAELSGTVAADLVIRPEGREWVRTAQLLAPRAFNGTSIDQPLTIDLVAVGALIAQISEETGLSGGTFEVVVVARVEGVGTNAGEPLEVLFEQPFTLRYDRTLITPPAERTMTVQASSTELVTNSKSLSLVLWSPSISAARALSVIGFVTALGAVVVFGGYLALGLSSSEEARIRARYGSRLVDVQGADTGPAEDSVRVASMRDLSRLAERFGSVILHQPLPAGHRYFVRDGDDTYEYVIASAATSGPFGASSPVDTAGS